MSQADAIAARLLAFALSTDDEFETVEALCNAATRHIATLEAQLEAAEQRLVEIEKDCEHQYHSAIIPGWDEAAQCEFCKKVIDNSEAADEAARESSKENE